MKIKRIFLITAILFLCSIFCAAPCFSQKPHEGNLRDLRKSPVSYHMSFDNRDFFEEDFIEQSGKKSLEERKIDFPEGKFGKGIRMSFIPDPPDETNMSGIDLDLITAVLFNTHPGNTMGYNEPFIWGGGRINARLGAVAFWAKGKLPFATPLFEQTTISFGRKERDLLGVFVDQDKKISAYVKDARYVRHELLSDVQWDHTVWNHIVLNWDWANAMELWLNGKRIASSWGKAGWFETALPGLFHLPAPGIVYDELFLLDRPLAESEIKRLMVNNQPPKEETQVYTRKSPHTKNLAKYSGADKSEHLPTVTPALSARFREVWPTKVSDGKIPGWHLVDGRNEMAWPHEYAFFTIIPGDGDYHAQKADIKIPARSVVNYLSLTGNLTDVKVQSGIEDIKHAEEVLKVPQGEHFFYGSMIPATEGATFRIPFTESFGTPPDFNGDILLPLSGEKRIQELGMYHVTFSPIESTPFSGEKLVIHTRQPELIQRTWFPVHSLVARDERRIIEANASGEKGKKIYDIGAFARLNIFSKAYDQPTGIKEISLSIPIKTANKEEVLFLRMRDPGVPSRLWNQLAVKLSGYDRSFKMLHLTIDIQDLVVTVGDRLWLDIGTAGQTEVLIGDPGKEADLFVSTAPAFECMDEYANKEIVPCQSQYSKQYEYMPWQFSGKQVSFDNPYCYGGSFDMIFPALAIQRVKPDDFVANFFIKMSSNDFKDGYLKKPESAPLISLPNPNHAPEWAVYWRDYNQKRWKIVKWWMKRQNADGQIGGGWNDDTLFGNMGFEDIALDGNNEFIGFLNVIQTKFELTKLFKDGFCNIYPIDRMHTGDFISERYKTLIYNLGQAYATEREMESAWRLGKPDKTPVNYYENGFKSSVNVLNWYWGKDVPTEPYISRPLPELTLELQRFSSLLDSNSFYRMTAAHVMTDDFVPYGSSWSGRNNIYTYMLGGERGTRIDAHPRLAVSWPYGGGADVARLVMFADDQSLQTLVYSFDDKLHKLGMRFHRIKDGRYSIKLYPDSGNGTPKGEPIWSTEKDIFRFDVATVPIPPKTPLILSVEQIKAYERPALLPDLAIDPWDAVWEDNSVTAEIHNLGNGRVENVRVRLLDGEKIIGDKFVPVLEAAADFIPKKTTISFLNIPYSQNLKIVIDPLNNIREILKENNQVKVLPSTYQSDDPILWNLYQKKPAKAWEEFFKKVYGNEQAFSIQP